MQYTSAKNSGKHECESTFDNSPINLSTCLQTMVGVAVLDYHWRANGQFIKPGT